MSTPRLILTAFLIAVTGLAIAERGWLTWVTLIAATMAVRSLIIGLTE